MTVARGALGRQQAEVMAHLARYCRDHHIPPLDRGLRSIVVQQTRNVLRGGWPVEEILPVAVELASRYTRFDGHKALLGLQRTIETADEGRAAKAHQDRMADERATPMHAGVAAVIARPAARASDDHPSRHPFTDGGPDRESCLRCGGGIGVHIRLVTIDDEGRAITVPTGVTR